jgi:hypothetical protein
MKSLLYLSFSLVLLSLRNAAVMQESHCHQAKTCDECVNFINDGFGDDSKCLPVLSTKVRYGFARRVLTDEDEEGNITCASWKDIQEYNLTLDIKCNHDSIS